MTVSGSIEQGPVDVHCHVCPIIFPDAPDGASGWPCMHRRSPVDASIILSGKPFRRLDDRSWSPARRIEDMDRDGIAVQVLSPMPELLSYWFRPTDGAFLCDFINAQIASLVAQAPRRFLGLGAVPLQDIDLAIAHLERAKRDFGLAGVEIGTNVNGKLIGDPGFDPFFAAAEALDLAVFVHALHPIAGAGLGHPAAAAMIGFPTDVGLAAASVILSGTLDKYPALRLGFSHGGGTLPALIHRLDAGWASTDGFGGTLRAAPKATARAMFFDSNVYSAELAAHIEDQISPGKVFIGTDYPYPIMQKDPVGYLGGKEAARDRSSLLWRAAHKFLAVEMPGG